MLVEIWSDIVCPWCYIGRRRFEKALEQFEHRDQVEVIWRSYQLDPNAPRDFAGTPNDLLMQRYGMSPEKAQRANAHVTELAAEEGLEYHLDKAHPVNSMDAHRLLHLASQHHLQSQMKERLQKAYFTDGLVISDLETLVKLAVEVGLDAEETRKMLAGDAFTSDVISEARLAQELGSDGVPFFVFDNKYAFSGAQPSAIFLSTLEKTWENSHPIDTVANTKDHSAD